MTTTSRITWRGEEEEWEQDQRNQKKVEFHGAPPRRASAKVQPTSYLQAQWVLWFSPKIRARNQHVEILQYSNSTRNDTRALSGISLLDSSALLNLAPVAREELAAASVEDNVEPMAVPLYLVPLRRP